MLNIKLATTIILDANKLPTQTRGLDLQPLASEAAQKGIH